MNPSNGHKHRGAGAEASRHNEVRDVRLRSETGGDSKRNQHGIVARNNRPCGQQDDDPRNKRQVRVPRLGEHREAVATDEKRDDERHHYQSGPPGTPVPDPECKSDPQRLQERR